jgi:rhodanese-related sulfurtransferase
MPTTPPTSGVREIDPKTVKQWLDAGEAVLIDVREPDEHARERIPQASLSPLSKFDPGTLPGGGRTRIVLHCKSGRRSMDAAARLVNAAGCEAFSLRGGIEAWKAAGLEVRENRKVPISLMRQAQITMGIALLAGAGLAYWSPWFLILPVFIGAGQLFAGLSGTCGLAALLSLAPWNRAVAGCAAQG